MNKKAIKSAFMSDSDVTTLLDQQDKMESMKSLLNQGDFISSLKMIFGGKDGYTPVKGEDYFTIDEIDAIKADVIKGATPEKFKDYFTEKEISYIMNSITSSILQRFESIKSEVTPVKGVDYRDGIDAVVNEESIASKVISMIPQADKVDFEALVKKAVDSVQIPTISDVVKEIKKKKLIDRQDIKGMPLNMNDQRWHGGGISTVSHDSTLTGNGTPSNPLSVVATPSFTIITATGAVNGINQSFVFATTPSVIVVDQGRVMRQISSDGNINWTGTTNVTLQIAPTSDIYGY